MNEITEMIKVEFHDRAIWYNGLSIIYNLFENAKNIESFVRNNLNKKLDLIVDIICNTNEELKNIVLELLKRCESAKPENDGRSIRGDRNMCSGKNRSRSRSRDRGRNRGVNKNVNECESAKPENDGRSIRGDRNMCSGKNRSRSRSRDRGRDRGMNKNVNECGRDKNVNRTGRRMRGGMGGMSGMGGRDENYRMRHMTGGMSGMRDRDKNYGITCGDKNHDRGNNNEWIPGIAGVESQTIEACKEKEENERIALNLGGGGGAAGVAALLAAIPPAMYAPAPAAVGPAAADNNGVRCRDQAIQNQIIINRF
eukprot:425639_1